LTAAAAVTHYQVVPPAVTPPDTEFSARGVWFNILTGVVDVRKDPIFPDPLLENGKFMLKQNKGYSNVEAAAELYIEGFISLGNSVVTTPGGNPAKLAAGTVIGPASNIPSNGGFVDLGPTFGPWRAGDQGFLGLRASGGFTTPAGPAVKYGYAEILIGADYSVTLLSFGVENDVGVAVTTPALSVIPEPSALGLASVGGLALLRRRK
jgi:MYXO-CTERM domain-containing protein